MHVSNKKNTYPQVDTRYYTSFRGSGKGSQLDRTFLGNLPRFSPPSWEEVQRAARIGLSGSWISQGFHLMLGVVGVTVQDVVHFFSCCDAWTLGWIARTTLRCDFEAITTCSAHKHDLPMSVLVFLVFYLAVSTVGGWMGMPVLGTLFFASGPFFLLWYSYGVSPQCLPMLPPCLLDDVLVFATSVLPSTVALPASLLACPVPPNASVSPTCLRSCSALNFTTWADPLAFAMCDVGSPAWCISLLNTLEVQVAPDPANTTADVRTVVLGFATTSAELLLGPLRTSLGAMGTLRERGVTDLAGHRLCTLVTWIYLLPIALAAICAVTFAAAVVQLLVGLLPQLVNTVLLIFVLNHSGG